MRDNKFLKIFFRLLIMIPISSNFILASNQILNTRPIYKNLLNIPNKEPSIVNMIEKLKNGQALSRHDKNISDEKLIQFDKICPPERHLTK